MKKAFRILTNKFLITGLIFVAWMTYFDQNDWLVQRDRNAELEGIKSNISYLSTEIARMEEEQKAMTTDPKRLEQFAREQYRMKRDNEDVYVIQ